MPQVDPSDTRLIAVVFVLVVAVIVLGRYVTTRHPTVIDTAAYALRGHATNLAAFFTTLGRTPVLLAITAIAMVGALAFHRSVVPIAYVGVVQLLGQGANALLKLAFDRVRPDKWLRYHERDLSYPSGHAMTTVVFFVGLLLLVVRAPIPWYVIAPLATALAVCVVGIPWSRLALGAHYLTDVCAGLMFGTAWLIASVLVAARLPIATLR